MSKILEKKFLQKASPYLHSKYVEYINNHEAKKFLNIALFLDLTLA